MKSSDAKKNFCYKKVIIFLRLTECWFSNFTFMVIDAVQMPLSDILKCMFSAAV